MNVQYAITVKITGHESSHSNMQQGKITLRVLWLNFTLVSGIFLCLIFIKIYYFTIVPFYHIRAKVHKIYGTLLHSRTEQKYGVKAEQQNDQTKLYFDNKSLIQWLI